MIHEVAHRCVAAHRLRISEAESYLVLSEKFLRSRVTILLQ
jgi:hypothetical protein